MELFFFYIEGQQPEKGLPHLILMANSTLITLAYVQMELQQGALCLLDVNIKI